MAAILKKWRPLLDFWWLTCFFDQIVPKDASYQISCLHHKLKDFKGNLLGYIGISDGNNLKEIKSYIKSTNFSEHFIL